MTAVRFHDRLSVVEGNRGLFTLMAAGTRSGPAAARACGDRRFPPRRQPVARANKSRLEGFSDFSSTSFGCQSGPSSLAQLAPARTLVREDVGRVDGGYE